MSDVNHYELVSRPGNIAQKICHVSKAIMSINAIATVFTLVLATSVLASDVYSDSTVIAPRPARPEKSLPERWLIGGIEAVAGMVEKLPTRVRF